MARSKHLASRSNKSSNIVDTPDSINPSSSQPSQVPQADVLTKNLEENNSQTASSKCPQPSEPTDITDVEEITEINKKQRKLTSKVWDDFERLVVEKTESDRKKTSTIIAKCHHCKTKFNGDSSQGTSHLKYHLDHCKSKPENQPGQAKLTTMKTSNQGKKLVNWKFNPDKTRLLAAKMIAKHGYAFNMVEHLYFRAFVKSLNPAANLFGRNTVRPDTIKVYDEIKIELQCCLDSLTSKCSLTTDMWSAKYTRDGYYCVTCHYIDDDYILHKKIIAYVLVPAPHTDLVLSEVVKSVALEWNIDNKMFALATDNASSNDVMIDNIKDWLVGKGCLVLEGALFRMRCNNHILHLVVQKGLEVATSFIDKIRESVKYVKSSQDRKEKFENALMQVRLAGRYASLDVENRWNSTYRMLRNVINLRQGFVRLTELDRSFKCLPNSDEWDQGIVICDCLKVFYDITVRFSGVKYPTTNMYFKSVYEVNKNIRSWESSPHHYIRSMELEMRGKFDSYWRKSNLLMCIGDVLDPRYKMRIIEFVFQKLYDDHLSGTHLNNFRQTLNNIFSSYESQNGSSPPDYFGNTYTSGLGLCSANLDSGEVTSEDIEFDEFITQNSSVDVQKTELEKYLEEPLFPKGVDECKFDILSWWKNDGPKYPTLAKMARDILVVHVSTVASESAFSGGGRVLTKHRSSLSPEIVQVLCCLSDWLPDDIDVDDLI